MCPSCGEPEIDAYGACLYCGYAVTGEDRARWAEEQGMACVFKTECVWPECNCDTKE